MDILAFRTSTNSFDEIKMKEDNSQLLYLRCSFAAAGKKSYLLFVAHSPTPPVQEGGDVGTKSDLRVSKD